MVGEKEGWLAVPPGTRKSTYELPEYQKAAPFASTVVKAILSADPAHPTKDPVPYTGVQFVAIPEFQGIGTLVGQQIASALAGQQSVDAALDNAQKQVEREMKKARGSFAASKRHRRHGAADIASASLIGDPALLRERRRITHDEGAVRGGLTLSFSRSGGTLFSIRRESDRDSVATSGDMGRAETDQNDGGLFRVCRSIPSYRIQVFQRSELRSKEDAGNH
ncbi:hypothetical protein GGD50_004059 [Rhizobium paranaense]|uniref:Uncharacterized protein n=1 Tax=Rhizobium paranaense TaxID=1650438 RepID=A0A7W8XU56_9HYPH|nr:hypothetical protein [Rhizobium paranaense]